MTHRRRTNATSHGRQPRRRQRSRSAASWIIGAAVVVALVLGALAFAAADRRRVADAVQVQELLHQARDAAASAARP